MLAETGYFGFSMTLANQPNSHEIMTGVRNTELLETSWSTIMKETRQTHTHTKARGSLFLRGNLLWLQQTECNKKLARQSELQFSYAVHRLSNCLCF